MAAIAHKMAGPGGRSSISGRRAVVFGAYGFIGRYVVQRLARQGTQVVVPYRCDPYDIRHLRPTGDLGIIRPVYCEPSSDDDLNVVTKGADVVYNLMGQHLGTQNWPLERVHVDLPGRLAAIAKANGVGRFVQMSAVGADSSSPSAFYATKARGEEVVREIFPEATIVRSAKIFGAEDQYSNRISNTFQRLPRFIPFFEPDGGKALRCPIYVGDVAQALVETMTHKEAPGSTYELVGPVQCSVREFTRMVSDVVFREHSYGYVPYSILSTLGPLAHPVASILLKTKMLHKDIIDTHLVDEHPSDLKGLQDLNVTSTPFNSVAIRWLRRFRPPMLNQTTLSDGEYKVNQK